MNNQELISRLQETSLALEQLAQHLSAIEQPLSETATSSEAEENEPLPEPLTEELNTEAKAEISVSVEEATEPEPEMTDIIIETTFEPIAEESEEKAAEKKENPQDAAASNNNPANNNPFAKIVSNLLNKPLPNANSMPGFNPLQMLTGGLAGMSNMPGIPGLSGLTGLPGLNQQSLPTTLAELHDNPQLLGMIKNVSNNPQMLNMLAGLTGQDSQTLQQTLQSLQPNAAANAASAASAASAAAADTVNAAINPTVAESAAPAAPMPNINFNPMAAAASTNSMPSMPTSNLPETPYLDSLLAEWHWQPYARAWIF